MNAIPCAIVIENACVPFGAVPFDAVIVPVNVPAVVGVPEITPAEFNVRPGGKAPAVTAYVIGVLPVAVIV